MPEMYDTYDSIGFQKASHFTGMGHSPGGCPMRWIYLRKALKTGQGTVQQEAPVYRHVQIIPESGPAFSLDHVPPASHENRAPWFPLAQNRRGLPGQVVLSFHPLEIRRKRTLKTVPTAPRSANAHQKGRLFIATGI